MVNLREGAVKSSIWSRDQEMASSLERLAGFTKHASSDLRGTTPGGRCCSSVANYSQRARKAPDARVVVGST